MKMRKEKLLSLENCHLTSVLEKRVCSVKSKNRTRSYNFWLLSQQHAATIFLHSDVISHMPIYLSFTVSDSKKIRRIQTPLCWLQTHKVSAVSEQQMTEDQLHKHSPLWQSSTWCQTPGQTSDMTQMLTYTLINYQTLIWSLSILEHFSLVSTTSSVDHRLKNL